MDHALDDFPRPNPHFGDPVSPTRGEVRKLFLSRALFLLVLAMLGFGLLGMPTLGWLGKEGFNWPARIYFFGMVGFIPAAVFYRQQYRLRQWREGDIIPVEVTPASDALWKAILIGLPLFILGLVGGICFVVARAFELGGRKPWLVRYVEGGRVKSMKVWLPEEEMARIYPGSVVWLTRPAFFVPPRVVGHTYGVNEVELTPDDVYQWLLQALHKAEGPRY